LENNFAGSCLCGNVRYTITASPELIVACHCKNCQKQTGSAFSLFLGTPRDGVHVEGPLTTYHDKGDSGKDVDRLFCGRCGSCVLANADVRPDLSFVFGGTLEDTSDLHPRTQIFCDSAQPWLHLTGLESFARLPPEET
jgi:hypothetical protein